MEHETPVLPAYQRVAEAIQSEIRAGSLASGDRLLGNRGVAEKYGVALGTAQKALNTLEEQGWVTTTPSVGVFVNPARDETPDATEDLATAVADLRATVADLSARVKALESRE